MGGSFVRADHTEADAPGNAEIARLRRLIDGSKPITFQEFAASEAARTEDWRRRFRMNEDFSRAEPNAGHHLLVRLCEEGRLQAVITQNIDGLHRRAGM